MFESTVFDIIVSSSLRADSSHRGPCPFLSDLSPSFQITGT